MKWVVYIAMPILIGCMALYHLLPYNDTFTNVLYYFSDHGYKILASILLYKMTKINWFKIASIYFGLKLIYHLSLLNKDYSEYLGSIESEVGAGMLTIVLLIFLIYKHETIEGDFKNIA